MNYTSLEQALEALDKLQIERILKYNELTDLGEKQPNKPQEDFERVRRELDAIDDRIAELGEIIAQLSGNPSTEPTTEETTETSTEQSTEETTETSTEQSTEETTEASTEQSTEETTEASTEQSTEETTEASTEQSTEETTETSTEQSTEETTETSTEQSTEETTETSTEQSTEQTTETSTEQSTEQTTEASTEQSTEETTETSTEQSTEQTTETSTEQSTEETTEASTEQSTEQTTEASTEQSTEPSTNPTTEPSTTKVWTPEDYKMNQEAWDEYIAEGFEPGTPDWDSAVILDGTGVVPTREPSTTKVWTPEDYKMNQEAWDEYIAEGFEPGTPDWDSAVILDGTGVVPTKEQSTEPTTTNTATPSVPTNNNQEELDRLQSELDAAKRQVQTSIDKMRKIYSDTQQVFEEGEWNKTVDSFDILIEEYIAKMRAEDAIYIEAQKRVQTLERQIAQKQKEQQQDVERARLAEEARGLNITLEQYQQIVRAANNRNIYRPVFEQMGLGDIMAKRGRTKEDRARVNAARQELIERLVEVQQRTAETINIRETVNVLYGTELSVRRSGKPREIKVTSDEITRITTTAEKEPKRLIKDPNYTPNYTPGQRPADMPRRGWTPEDYHMTQGAWDDYIAQGFEPGTHDFDGAVILDGTGIIPTRNNTPTTPIVTPTTPRFTPPAPRLPGSVTVPRLTGPTISPTVPRLTPGITPTTPRVTPTVPKFTPPAPRLPGSVTVPRLTGPTISPTVPMLPPGITPTTPRVTPTVPVIVPTIPTKTPTVPVITPTVPTKTPTVPVLPPRVTPTPKPTPTLTPKPTPTMTPTPKKPKVGLISTIEKVTKGLEVSRKDGKAYQAANIRIAEGFKNELSSGNYLYNIVHFVPAIVKLPFQFLTKISGKLRFTKSAKQRIKTMKDRIDNLTEEELMVIYEEYRGNRVMQERFPSAINILLQEKIERFVMRKVTDINAKLELDYEDIFGAMMELEALDAQLRDKNLSKADRQQLTNYRNQLLQGRAQQVQRIRANYVEAQKWLSGGLNGFSQDMKAAATKLSIVGKRFAKDHDLDLELLSKEAKLERAEMAAIEEGNDQMALLTFIQAESLLSKETEISGSLFGKRSTGKKYYSPLAEKLDYRDDPFIRDLFTTVAVTSAALSTINTIKGAPSSAEIDEANRQLQEAQDFVDQVKGTRGTMKEGMEAQGIHDTSTITGQVERGALDSTDWALGTGKYRTADNAGHDFYNQVFSNTQSQVQNISQQYASGAITELEALQMMRDMANGTQQTLNNVSNQCLGIFEQYAQTHPQFDLTAVTEAVRYIQQNPDAITNMNNAIVDIQTAAEGLTFTQIQALQQVPNSLLVTLLGTASAAALASNINKQMEANVKAGKYGNAVTDMVSEYVAEHTQDQSAERRR